MIAGQTIAAKGIAKAAALYILAAAQASCPILPAPKVVMNFTTNPPVELNDKTGAELGQYHISTTFSHSRNEIFTVGGLMMSEFSPEYRVLFNMSRDESGYVCISLAEVGIGVNYAPRIYIASEALPGTCRYKVTMQHELRHVNTDIITFNEFLPALTAAVQTAVDGLPPQAPVQQENMMQVQNRIMDTVRAALVAKTEEIEQQRQARQQMIDTRAEYLRASALCPGQ